jgi:hypothetical protein
VKSYLIQCKAFTRRGESEGGKTRGGKMQVTSNMLLKTNGEKMSEISLSKMLLKNKELSHPFQDVDEKKGT